MGDGLVGMTEAGERNAVATEDVEYVRVQKRDTVRTVLVMGCVMVTVVLLIAAFGCFIGRCR